jgi:hypothetical protein
MQLTQEHKDRIELWCLALESGKYPQAKRKLRRGDGFCCLGVACDISGLGAWDGVRYCVGNVGSDLSLPDPVAGFYGIHDSSPGLLNEDGIKVEAATLNDYQGYTFPQIAAAIRRTYLTEVK